MKRTEDSESLKKDQVNDSSDKINNIKNDITPLDLYDILSKAAKFSAKHVSELKDQQRLRSIHPLKSEHAVFCAGVAVGLQLVLDLHEFNFVFLGKMLEDLTKKEIAQLAAVNLRQKSGEQKAADSGEQVH